MLHDLSWTGAALMPRIAASLLAVVAVLGLERIRRANSAGGEPAWRRVGQSRHPRARLAAASGSSATSRWRTQPKKAFRDSRCHREKVPLVAVLVSMRSLMCRCIAKGRGRQPPGVERAARGPRAPDSRTEKAESAASEKMVPSSSGSPYRLPAPLPVGDTARAWRAARTSFICGLNSYLQRNGRIHTRWS